MDFQSYFPIWKKLTPMQQERILNSLTERKVSKGTVIHNGNMDCTGLLLVKSGQSTSVNMSSEYALSHMRKLERRISPPGRIIRSGSGMPAENM